MNKQLLLEKIGSYQESNCDNNLVSVENEVYLVFESDDSIDELLKYVNSLKCNFDSIDDLCNFLDLQYCYDDEIFYCGICEEYHFIDSGYYMVEHEMFSAACLEENIQDHFQDFVNNPHIALYNEIPKLEALGFKKAETEYNGCGIRGWKVDHPQDILDKYGKDYEIIFYISYSTPFDCTYSYYYRSEEEQ